MRWHLTPLRGTCVHPGFAVGRVRFAGEPPGDADVLVVAELQPADVPELFDCVAAVIERGGTTSHAAITARELGIPTLTEVVGATALLGSGDRVFVDSENTRILRAEVNAECPFCNADQTPELGGGLRLRVIEDLFPVVRGHLLVVPRRHVTDPAQIEPADWVELGSVLDDIREAQAQRSGSRDVNLAMNVGPAAGQTIQHVHWHVLPRRPGDDADPRGGVRRLVTRPWRTYPPA